MTTNHQIHFVHKIPRQDIHSAIQHVGGRNPDGSIWKRDLNAAIRDIQNGTYKFYVAVGGAFSWVEVARSAAGNLYLKTVPDHTWTDNLLSLPEFPSH